LCRGVRRGWLAPGRLRQHIWCCCGAPGRCGGCPSKGPCSRKSSRGCGFSADAKAPRRLHMHQRRHQYPMQAPKIHTRPAHSASCAQYRYAPSACTWCPPAPAPAALPPPPALALRYSSSCGKGCLIAGHLGVFARGAVACTSACTHMQCTRAHTHTRMPASTRASRPLHIQRWQCLIACKQSAHHASARSFCPLKHERTPATCTSRAHQRQHTATGARTLARPAAARELFRSAIRPPGAGNCPAQLSGTSFGRQGPCLAT